MIQQAKPEIVPLNYAVDRGTLICRHGGGEILSKVSHHDPCAFEVDALDEDSGIAWSVVLHGELELITGSELVETIDLALAPLQPGRKPSFLRLVPQRVTGRRFEVVSGAVRSPASA